MSLFINDYVVADQGHLYQVHSVEKCLVTFTSGDVGGIDWAKEHRSPVQRGSVIRTPMGYEARVSYLVSDPDHGIRVHYVSSDPFEEGQVTWISLQDAKERLVEDVDHFPIGTRVRFRRDVTYTVTSWDGDLHDLVPDDGSENLCFGPDFFEVIEYPEVTLGRAAVRDGETFLIHSVDDGDGAVSLLSADGNLNPVTRTEFHRDFKVLPLP